MSISSVTSASTQAVFKTNAEDLVEGVKPDGDGDQDDRNTTSSTPKAQVTASVGNNINVSA